MSSLAMLALALSVLLSAPSARALEPQPASPTATPCPAEQAGAQAPVDLNSADEEALVGLPGIGPSRARAIVAYRAAHGSFRSLSQLLQIKGIGRALLRQLRPLVTLSGSTS